MDEMREKIIAEYEAIAFAAIGGAVKVSEKLKALAALWEIAAGFSLASAREPLVINYEYVDPDGDQD